MLPKGQRVYKLNSNLLYKLLLRREPIAFNNNISAIFVSQKPFITSLSPSAISIISTSSKQHSIRIEIGICVAEILGSDPEMWRSPRRSRRDNDIDGSSIHRSPSNLKFCHRSFKDVENLFGDGDDNGFNKTLDQQPCSNKTARRLSIFHRVHLANQFARAFSSSSTKQISNPEKKPPPESNNAVAAPEKLGKSDRLISIPGAEKRVVVYTTSLRVVRPTFEACRTVQSILRGFRVSIDERDLSMDSRFLDELQNIMAEGGEDEIEKSKLTLPRVFIGGRYIGGAEEVKQLHETGELKKFIDGLPAVTAGVCEGCGDFRFILCDECSGSHKCYTEKGGFRSCTLCNENGLIRCPFCLGR